jgi:hypothetical protein
LRGSRHTIGIAKGIDLCVPVNQPVIVHEHELQQILEPKFSPDRQHDSQNKAYKLFSQVVIAAFFVFHCQLS